MDIDALMKIADRQHDEVVRFLVDWSERSLRELGVLSDEELAHEMRSWVQICRNWKVGHLAVLRSMLVERGRK